MSELNITEMHGIIGVTMERLKEARKKLACLNVKAKDKAKDINTVAAVILGEMRGGCANGAFFVDIPQGTRNIEWPTVQDMNDILVMRKNLEEEILELENTCREMGYDTVR